MNEGVKANWFWEEVENTLHQTEASVLAAYKAFKEQSSGLKMMCKNIDSNFDGTVSSVSNELGSGEIEEYCQRTLSALTTLAMRCNAYRQCRYMHMRASQAKN